MERVPAKAWVSAFAFSEGVWGFDIESSLCALLVCMRVNTCSKVAQLWGCDLASGNIMHWKGIAYICFTIAAISQTG
eukprot:6238870-Amphidinium_carterae.1